VVAAESEPAVGEVGGAAVHEVGEGGLGDLAGVVGVERGVGEQAQGDLRSAVEQLDGEAESEQVGRIAAALLRFGEDLAGVVEVVADEVELHASDGGVDVGAVDREGVVEVFGGVFVFAERFAADGAVVVQVGEVVSLGELLVERLGGFVEQAVEQGEFGGGRGGPNGVVQRPADGGVAPEVAHRAASLVGFADLAEASGESLGEAEALEAECGDDQGGEGVDRLAIAAPACAAQSSGGEEPPAAQVLAGECVGGVGAVGVDVQGGAEAALCEGIVADFDSDAAGLDGERGVVGLLGDEAVVQIERLAQAIGAVVEPRDVQLAREAIDRKVACGGVVGVVRRRRGAAAIAERVVDPERVVELAGALAGVGEQVAQRDVVGRAANESSQVAQGAARLMGIEPAHRESPAGDGVVGLVDHGLAQGASGFARSAQPVQRLGAEDEFIGEARRRATDDPPP